MLVCVGLPRKIPKTNTLKFVGTASQNVKNVLSKACIQTMLKRNCYAVGKEEEEHRRGWRVRVRVRQIMYCGRTYIK